MIVTVCSNQPPGGRCRLYLSYAEVIAEAFAASVRVIYPDAPQPASPPALLLDGKPVEPEDGIMLTPDDIAGALDEMGIAAGPALRAALESARPREQA